MVIELVMERYGVNGFSLRLPKIGEPFSFFYVGDAQNYILELWSRLIREGYKAPTASFIIHAGDLINDVTKNISGTSGLWLVVGFIDHFHQFQYQVTMNTILKFRMI